MILCIELSLDSACLFSTVLFFAFLAESADHTDIKMNIAVEQYVSWALKLKTEPEKGKYWTSASAAMTPRMLI